MMDKQELENMRLMVITSISEELAEVFAQPAEVNWRDEFLSNNYTLVIKQRVFGKHILHDEVSYPADWKEAFKERWFPVWAKDRWPVRYTKKTFDVRELVPSLDIPGHKVFVATDIQCRTTWREEK